MKSNTDTVTIEADEIMTLREIARYLKVSEKSVLRMAQAGSIPAGKVASQWRFRRSLIENWLAGKMENSPDGNLANVLRTKKSVLTPIPRLIGIERIVMGLEQAPKETILRRLAGPMAKQGLVANTEAFVAALLERENMVSTATGHGIALPHVHEPGRSGVKETCVVLGISQQGIDFDSLDGELTYLFFMICADSLPEHLRLMAKIVLMLRMPGLTDRLRTASDEHTAMKVLLAAHQEMSIRL